MATTGIVLLNESDSDKLRLKKINENFRLIATGGIAVGAVQNRGGGYTALVNSITPDVLKTTNLQAYLVDTEFLTAAIASVGVLMADTAYFGDLTIIGKITQNGTQIETQGGKIEAIETEMKMDGSTISVMGSKIRANESNIGLLSSDVSLLDSTVSGFDSRITANASEIDSTNALLSWNDTYTTVSSAIQNIENSIVALQNATVELNNSTISAINAQLQVTADGITLNGTKIIELQDGKLSLDAHEISAKSINADRALLNEFYANIGLIDDLTIVDGHVVGELAAVTINGDKIIANTIYADKIVYKDLVQYDPNNPTEWATESNGLFLGMNEAAMTSTEIQDMVSNYDEYGFSSEAAMVEALESGLAGSLIIAGTIDANKINVADLKAFAATIAGFHIDDYGNDQGIWNGADPDSSNIQIMNSGYVRLGSSTSYLEVDPGAGVGGEVNLVVDNTNVKEDLTMADTWKWDVRSNGHLSLRFVG